jgi:MFS family permease
MVAGCNSALDVLLKNGVIVFAAYRGDLDGRALSLVATLSWALFMAPYFIFSAHGGWLGDHINNRRLALVLKGCDLAIAALAAFAFQAGHIPLLLGLVFAKGVTATLYSPIKYALVADFLPPDRRGMGYAVVETASMIAILGGTYLGAALGADADGWKIGALAVAIAGAGLLAAAFYPDLPRLSKARRSLGLDPIQPTVRILRRAFANRRAFAAILALSWFWALGAIYLSNIPVLVRDTFHGDTREVAAILVIFTLGVSLGLGASAWIERSRRSGSVGMVTAMVMAAMGAGLLGAGSQASSQALLLFFGIAFASGVYSGHYSSRLYGSAGEEEKSRLFAANNIMSSLVMVLALALNALLFRLNVSVEMGLALFAAASIPITFFVEAKGAEA